jgi:hypothetical protein
VILDDVEAGGGRRCCLRGLGRVGDGRDFEEVVAELFVREVEGHG